MTTTTPVPVPPVPPVPEAAHDLLERAALGLRCACVCDRVEDRYRCAHLAAIRAASALLAARRPAGSSSTRRQRPRSVWDLLGDVAPDLGEWALFLEDSGRRRQGLDTGRVRVTSREADDLVRQVQVFLELIRDHVLGADPTRAQPGEGRSGLALLPAH